ncbi:hypothetical protein Ancab_016274, partial [Ancistrocladus abbreviatus]
MSLLLLEAFFLTVQFHIVASAEEPINLDCHGPSFPPNSSTYQYSLSNLFRNLSSEASITGFYKVIMGQSPYELYGLFLCRGNVDQEACNNWVGDATKAIANECPYHTDAMVCASCFGKKGGTLYFGTSCYVRYENFLFYHLAGSAPAANPVG